MQELERQRDGINYSGSEEQELKISPNRVNAEVPSTPTGQDGLTAQ